MVWVFVVVVFAILKNGAEFGMMSFDYGDYGKALCALLCGPRASSSPQAAFKV